VAVHEDVDDRIEQNRQVHVAIKLEGNDETDHNVDGAMMEHVQEGDLPERFPHDEKPRVEELPKLLRIKNPEHMSHEICVTIVVGTTWDHTLVANEFETATIQHYIDYPPNNIASRKYATEIVNQQN
jgi:hypothetical protein